MNLFQKQQKTSRYNSIPDAIADDKTAAVPFGTPPSSTTVIMGHRSSTGRVAFVAGMLLLLVVLGGGAVGMTEGGRTTTTIAAEGLVTATEVNVDCRVKDNIRFLIVRISRILFWHRTNLSRHFNIE